MTTNIKDGDKNIRWHTLFSFTGRWGFLRGPVGANGLAADPLAIHRDDRVLCILYGQNNVQHVLLKINKVHQINPVIILISLRKAACYVSDDLILVVLHVPRHTTNSSVYATEPSTLTWPTFSFSFISSSIFFFCNMLSAIFMTWYNVW